MAARICRSEGSDAGSEGSKPTLETLARLRILNIVTSIQASHWVAATASRQWHPLNSQLSRAGLQPSRRYQLAKGRYDASKPAGWFGRRKIGVFGLRDRQTAKRFTR